ncbi:peptidoglycan DD-metalloendopeptidase family protein [Arenimonas sp.]|uniref:peptidoglycan DD-metalloendopeptidase family protein n=1 Tax=Arenimonas sp. TaxID=1872635 RepID=UPI0035AFFA32
MRSAFARLVVATLVLALLAACGQSRVVRREGSRPAPPRPAAASVPRDGSYEVRRGDTLYGIAFRHGLDYREVAEWNRIPPPYTIYPGQRLRLKGAAPARGPVRAAAPAPARPVTGMPPPRSGTTGTVSNRPGANAPREVSPAVASAPPAGTAAGTLPAASPAGTPPAATPAPATPAPAPAVPAAVSAAGWRWPAQGQLIGRFVAGDPKRQGIDIAGNAGQPVLAAADGVVVYSGAGLVGYGELIIVKHSDEWLSAYAHNRRRLVGEGAQVRAGQQIAELGRTGTSRDMLHFEVRRNGKPVDPLQVLPRP